VLRADPALPTKTAAWAARTRAPTPVSTFNID
jgi:hypothetical protein